MNPGPAYCKVRQPTSKLSVVLCTHSRRDGQAELSWVVGYKQTGFHQHALTIISRIDDISDYNVAVVRKNKTNITITTTNFKFPAQKPHLLKNHMLWTEIWLKKLSAPVKIKLQNQNSLLL